MSASRTEATSPARLRLTVAALAIALSSVAVGGAAMAVPVVSASGGAQTQPADIGPVFPPHCGHCWNPG